MTAIIRARMRAAETVEHLSRFERRGPGTNAERRAARWLARELERGGRQVRIETFWCRPNWALAHCWHVALAVAGSLVSVASPRVGGALLVAALISLIADWLTGISPGRRLTPERASQNVVVSRAQRAGPPDRAHPRLIITANYDAGRMGLAYRDFLRGISARLRSITRGFAPGWLGWVVVATAGLVAAAILRLEGDRGTVVGVGQLVPTAALVLALALLLDTATADYGPAAGDNGSGVAAAVALVRALDAAPPQHMAVEVVLAGAGEGGGIGLRRYLRARKRELRAPTALVIGVAPCAGGSPRWWLSDGQLMPVRYFPRLRQLCAEVADSEPHLGSSQHRGRGATPALPARLAGLPAIALGCLDERGREPRSHQPEDTVASIDPAALERTVQFGLVLIDAVDSSLAGRQRRQIATRA